MIILQANQTSESGHLENISDRSAASRDGQNSPADSRKMELTASADDIELRGFQRYSDPRQSDPAGYQRHSEPEQAELDHEASVSSTQLDNMYPPALYDFEQDARKSSSENWRTDGSDDRKQLPGLDYRKQGLGRHHRITDSRSSSAPPTWQELSRLMPDLWTLSE